MSLYSPHFVCVHVVSLCKWVRVLHPFLVPILAFTLAVSVFIFVCHSNRNNCLCHHAFEEIFGILYMILYEWERLVHDGVEDLDQPLCPSL